MHTEKNVILYILGFELQWKSPSAACCVPASRERLCRQEKWEKQQLGLGGKKLIFMFYIFPCD